MFIYLVLSYLLVPSMAWEKAPSATNLDATNFKDLVNYCLITRSISGTTFLRLAGLLTL